MNNQRKSMYYKGNPNVKDDGVEIPYEDWQIEEFGKCRDDAFYFANKYLKVIHPDRGLVNVDLYPYQKKMFENFDKNRFNIVLAPRQCGKCAKGTSKIKVRNKKTGVVEKVSMAEFHQRFA